MSFLTRTTRYTTGERTGRCGERAQTRGGYILRARRRHRRTRSTRDRLGKHVRVSRFLSVVPSSSLSAISITDFRANLLRYHKQCRLLDSRCQATVCERVQAFGRDPSLPSLPSLPEHLLERRGFKHEDWCASDALLITCMLSNQRSYPGGLSYDS